MSHFNAMKFTTSSPAPSSGGLLRPTPTPADIGQGLKSNQVYFPIVIISKANDQVVGTGTVFMEKKFLRGLSTVGHIEDIAVDKNQQGKKLGLRIIQALTSISEALGAYKTILNCSDHNIRKPIGSKPEAPFVEPLVQHSMRSVGSLRRRMKWFGFFVWCSQHPLTLSAG